jgi:hypothetical protein
LAKGQGVRRNVKAGTSVPGLIDAPPTIFLVILAVLASGKVPSIRSYFGLRTLCPTCGQQLDARRSLRRKIFLIVVGFMFLFTMVVILTAKH